MPSAADVEAAATGWPEAGDEAGYRLIIGPGLVQTGARHWSELVSAELAERVGVERSAARDRDAAAREALGLPERSRGRISGWSAASRARMVRKLAALDYAPILRRDRLPVMITLTLPGDWLTVAPTAAAWKRLVKMFRARWGRRWGEPLRGVWKLEFQRRGAPHLHALTAPPATDGFSAWLSETWADVVDHPDPDERVRHLAAGTGVDTATGLRARDPRRVAVYFSKHGTFAAKEYQDSPPPEWGEVLPDGRRGRPLTGRIWGVWGLEPLTAEVSISRRDAIEVQRLLRRHERARRVMVERRVPRGRTVVIDPVSGEVRPHLRTRVQRRRARRRTGRPGSGFQLANDAPALAADVRRYLLLISASKSRELYLSGHTRGIED